MDNFWNMFGSLSINRADDMDLDDQVYICRSIRSISYEPIFISCSPSLTTHPFTQPIHHQTGYNTAPSSPLPIPPHFPLLLLPNDLLLSILCFLPLPSLLLSLSPASSSFHILLSHTQTSDVLSLFRALLLHEIGRELPLLCQYTAEDLDWRAMIKQWREGEECAWERLSVCGGGEGGGEPPARYLHRIASTPGSRYV